MAAKLLSRLLPIFILWMAAFSVSEAKPRSSVKFKLVRQEDPADRKEHLILPFAFSTENLGFTVGLGGGAKGHGQDQLVVGAACWQSVDDASGFIGGIWDYRLPETDGLYFSIAGSLAYYPRMRAYTGASADPHTPPPGSNDSDEDDYAELSGNHDWLEASLELVLPMGAAGDERMPTVRVSEGMRVSPPLGGKRWHPMRSGVTNLLVRQYNRYRSFESDMEILDRTVHPVELALYHDNTDFPPNPSFGSSQYISISHDFGWGQSDQTWTFVEFEAAKYFDLGQTGLARQRVLALNFWTGETLSWKEYLDANDRLAVAHRPPYYEGARLGGMYRMRAYPANRFNSRSVIYSSLEYRHTPHWNPLGQVDLLRPFKIDWWQLVGFVEGGRVAESYDFPELIRDWKVDGGVSVRAFMAGAVVRLDFSVSNESNSVWLMLGHPF